MKIKIDGKLKKTKILLSKSAIRTRIKALADEINKNYPKDETLVILIVLNGALLFAADLMRHLVMPTEIETIRLKSYHGTQSVGNVAVLSELPQALKNKNVLVVEDIIDSGRTIQLLIKKLNEFNVKSASICTLLNKPESHLVPVHANYVGFNVGKNFVVGYGFDFDGKYRNIPYIREVLL